ncbi:MAG: GNAT family N-acetyltransferase [Pseudomonadota bacterium]
MTTLQLREARPGDGAALGRIRISGWRSAYRGIVPDAFMDTMNPVVEAERAEAALTRPDSPFRTVVAVIDGLLVGYVVFTAPDRPDVEERAEIKALYVDGRQQRSGAGSALFHHAVDALRPNFGELIVWCLEENPIGRAFYEKHGGRLHGPPQTFHLAEAENIELSEVGYLWNLL